VIAWQGSEHDHKTEDIETMRQIMAVINRGSASILSLKEWPLTSFSEMQAWNHQAGPLIFSFILREEYHASACFSPLSRTVGFQNFSGKSLIIIIYTANGVS
jgi:hypothetical protein